MTPEELFTAALGLGRQWRVAECRFEGEPKRLELRLEHVPGEHLECPQCRALCGVHDTLERRWRHLNFFQYRCELVAKVPRTWCRKDGVHQVQVPVKVPLAAINHLPRSSGKHPAKEITGQVIVRSAPES